MTKHLLVGGLVAAGFDPSGQYLLTVSHAGRGVFSCDDWGRVARDARLTYPKDGHADGIGPIEGMRIPVNELSNGSEKLSFSSPDGEYLLVYEDGVITVTEATGV